METFNLNNGIKVIFKQTKSVEILCLKLQSPISVLQEDSSKAGVTVLLYETMMKSTNKRSAETLAMDIENLGSSISSDVEYDYSGWTLNCMTQYFDQSCEILSDIISNPAFDSKEMDKEREFMIQAIKASRDNIKSVAGEKFASDFYNARHPYSKKRAGTEETLKVLTQQDLKDIYNKIYSTKGIVITVVGNIKKSVLKKTLNKYFGQINLTQEKPNIILPDNPVRTGNDVVVNSKFNQAFIIYAYDAPNVLDKDFITLKMINLVLGARMTGRLFIELREKLGLAYEVNSNYPTRTDKSYFEIYIGLDKKNIDITKKGIEKIMDDLCNTKISDKELNDTKNFVKGIYLLAHQSVEKQASYLSTREMMGLGYEYDDKYIELLSEVTPDDIIAVANKYFKQKPYKLILMPN
ncbi:MAG: insulinase family protein [Endomicrobiaceae bacterium]|nr:insulinase family protein [Endomicrobiaceae bacterium]